MYKSFKNKKYYLAFSTFPRAAKKMSKVYNTGIRNWESDDAKNYSLVLWRFRIVFAINKPEIGQCCG